MIDRHLPPLSAWRPSLFLNMLLIFGLFSHVGFSQTTRQSKKVDALFSHLDINRSPGCAIGIYREGKVIYQQSYGFSNLEYDIPIDNETIFHVASISKQFTCFAILLLQKEGLLDIDEDIRNFMPELPIYDEPVTFRYLMNHTSGIRDQWQLLAIAGWRLDDVITKDHIMKMILGQRELNFASGSEYLYSNSGYSILARIVERITGQTFRDFLEEKVFQPLGMQNTQVHDDHQQIVPGRAYSYMSDQEEGFKKLVLSYANDGATSLFTTTGDLLIWMKSMISKSFHGDIASKMIEPGILNNGDTINYGLGLGVGEYKGIKYIGHGGADAGFRSAIRWFSDHDFGVVLLSNNAGMPATRTVSEIVDIYLEDMTTDPEEKIEEQFGSIALSSAELESFTGRYAISSPDLFFNIRLDEQSLILTQEWDNESYAIIPFDRQSFYKEGEEETTLEFKAANGVPHLVKIQLGRGTFPAERVVTMPGNLSMHELSGTYFSPEVQTTYWIRPLGDGLMVTHSRHPDFPISHVSGLKFKANIWWFNQLEFQQDDRGRITGFLVGGGRVRNLRFIKVN